MTEEDLLQLINGCIKQDRQSQKMLYKVFYGFAMSICLRYASNQYEASEIINEGFFKLFTNMNKYDPERPFKAWLSKIMHNVSIDYYRSNFKTSIMDDLERAEFVTNEASIESKLAYEDLLALIQQLPPAYRTVFNLFAIDGYSHDEIANMLNISSGTSKSNLFKARQKLQKMLMELSKKNEVNEVGFLAININQTLK
ncbi:RNA polymerase sigma factor [Solitalea koreensis]|uniref:RNA polymerase sigma-70 factor, ECF subfamily n=1 Tax=Solitalea koreensis TaxID=543615 RepID=A0A521C9H6_9SPHI|nr:sigma-70 family RNA polymerase sigma factor [Solitalea koreensis]SMO56137.1 RNA polymerase sigma-70 factor, ECF subfamily [Solitalea koreensis]